MTQNEVISKLREDMELRGYSQITISDYITRTKYYQNHYNKSADEMHEAEVRAFLHFQRIKRNNQGSTLNTYNSTLRFLYEVTLEKPISYRKVPRAKETRRLPQLPSKEDIATLFMFTKDLRYRAMFMTIYGSGLRVSELVSLKISDIDSKNSRIIIRMGKGKKDRFALLPRATLFILREYYKAYRPKEWLFENKDGNRLTTRAVQKAFGDIVEKSEMEKKPTLHTLRHCFATHLLNDGKNLIEIKRLLGHARIDTTAWYLQLSDNQALSLTSPLDSPEFSRNFARSSV